MAIIKPMINTTLPESGDFILLDTCVIIGLWSSRSKNSYRNQCQIFIKDTLINNNILCISVKTFEELRIVNEYFTIPKNKNIFGMDKSRYISDAINETNNLLNELDKLPNFYNEPIGLIDANTLSEIGNNQTIHNLRWGDAVIYTMAKQEGINNICTIDGDWLDLQDPEMTVYINTEKIKRKKPCK